jgi:hypothetical protein
MSRHCPVEVSRRTRGRVLWGLIDALGLGLFCCAPLQTAHAFSDPVAYSDPVDLGGGAGRWFTGSSADGFGCNVCHTGRAGEDLTISGLPVSGYVPGQSYEVSITWPPYVQDVALIAEFTNENRAGAGTLELPRPDALKPPELCVAEEGGESPAAIHEAEDQRQLVSLVDCGAKLLRFRWTAPLMAAGPIWFNAGFVVSNEDAAPTGDGVTLVARPLAPSGSALPTEQIAQGCSTVPRSFHAPPLLWILPLIAAGLRRRARRRKECHA